MRQKPLYKDNIYLSTFAQIKFCGWKVNRRAFPTHDLECIGSCDDGTKAQRINSLHSFEYLIYCLSMDGQLMIFDVSTNISL